jgi:hypothetical protein
MLKKHITNEAFKEALKRGAAGAFKLPLFDENKTWPQIKQEMVDATAKIFFERKRGGRRFLIGTTEC